MDLIIRGGNVITAESNYTADIGVRGGVIAQIGGTMDAPREIDASGKLVIPGGVDVHVHFEPDEGLGPDWGGMVDGYYSGSAGAAIGGITTFGNMVAPLGDEGEGDGGEGLMEMLERAEKCALTNSVLDFTLHPIIYHPTPDIIAEMPRMAEAGYYSIKIFTLFQFDRRIKDFINAIDAARQHGMITMMHCEDQPINGYLARRLIGEGKSGIQYYNDSRPDYAEAIATARAIAIGRATGASIYVVHLSSKAALEVARRNPVEGQRVYVETRPLYLHLDVRNYDEPNAEKYTGWPPLRDPEDVEALWHGVNAGNIHTVCSDHAPWTWDQKLNPKLNVGNFLPGMANLETMLPMLYDDGVRTGRITANKWVDLVATTPAKLFGMFPQKGTIAVGSDADIAVWDPDRKRTIRGEEMASNAGFDIYEGKEVRGWPEYTISRGEIIVDKGELVGSRGRGLRVKRGPHQPL